MRILFGVPFFLFRVFVCSSVKIGGQIVAIKVFRRYPPFTVYSLWLALGFYICLPGKVLEAHGGYGRGAFKFPD